MAWNLAKHAFGLWVTFFANIQDVVPCRHQISHEVMCDGHIGASGIYAMQTAFPRSAFHERRNAVGGENDRARGNLFKDTGSIWTIERDHSQVGEFFNRVAVMYNLPNNIHRAWLCGVLRYLANHLQCVNYAITIATGRNFNDFHLFLELHNTCIFSTPANITRRPQAVRL